MKAKTAKPRTLMRSKYKGFCSKCHYTIWQNEQIWFNGTATHFDCLEALKDKSQRDIDWKYVKTLGKVNKKKLRETIERKLATGAAGGTGIRLRLTP